MKDIEQSIEETNLQISTNKENANTLTFTFPKATKEFREALCKNVQQDSEAYRVQIRSLRNDSIKLIKDETNLPRDFNKLYRDKIQLLHDEFIQKINALVQAKQKELIKI